MNVHKNLIETTYQLARQAVKAGNHPFGAVLVIDDEVVLSQENTVNTSGDVTQHAELELVRKACVQLTREQLKKAILYTSTEPCAMCSGAIFWSGISNVVFGCSSQALGEITGGSLVIPCENIFNQGNRTVNVVGPVLEKKGIKIHQQYW